MLVEGLRGWEYDNWWCVVEGCGKCINGGEVVIGDIDGSGVVVKWGG